VAEPATRGSLATTGRPPPGRRRAGHRLATRSGTATKTVTVYEKSTQTRRVKRMRIFRTADTTVHGEHFKARGAAGVFMQRKRTRAATTTASRTSNVTVTRSCEADTMAQARSCAEDKAPRPFSVARSASLRPLRFVPPRRRHPAAEEASREQPGPASGRGEPGQEDPEPLPRLHRLRGSRPRRLFRQAPFVAPAAQAGPRRAFRCSGIRYPAGISGAVRGSEWCQVGVRSVLVHPAFAHALQVCGAALGAP
jgi:hypothetical protein